MASLKDLRNKIKSVKNIQQVTKAMKMVAAAKLRKSQENMEKSRSYTKAVSEMINHLIPDIDRSLLPMLSKRENKQALFVIITADRGMAGAFNANVIKEAEQSVDTFGKENSCLICIGKKSHDYFKRRDYNIINKYRDCWNELDFDLALKIGNEAVNLYENREVDSVNVIYNEFKNIGSQIVKNEEFLPVTYSIDKEIDKSCEMLYEPSKEDVVKSLIPKHLNIQMWQFLLESNASEQAARMVAMDNATENAGEMISDLSVEYNKARQAAITTEIIEIVSGANALEG